MKLFSNPMLLAFALSCLPLHGAAQVMNAPQGGSTTVLNFFGSPVTCSAANGAPVIFVFDYGLNDAGHASITPMGPIITINPSVLMSLINIDPRSALFVIGHECGHLHIPTTDESTADCFSATLGVQQGWFGSTDLPAMWAEFANNPGDWSHPPGPSRVAHITQCTLDAEAGNPDINIFLR